MGTLELDGSSAESENAVPTDSLNHGEENVMMKSPEKAECENDSEEIMMLNHIENSPAIFQSQQIGDPELSKTDKRKIAEDLLHKNPVTFLNKFGEYLTEDHLNYLIEKYNTYEVSQYAKNLKKSLSDHSKKILKRNRRYEAMKRLEAEGSYFSEIEMEKREPLLYHQMVGQYLSEKDKLLKNRQTYDNIIPTFSKFLMDKMDRDELNELRISQQKEEDGLGNESSSEDEPPEQVARWGESWEDEEKVQKEVKKKPKKRPKMDISAKEKDLLLKEFKSIMRSNFLNGKDIDFNYSEVDFNSEYDSIDIRTQDEEEKYFDEETYDNSVCTDTGIEDY